jgi:hypothetical protein
MSKPIYYTQKEIDSEEIETGRTTEGWYFWDETEAYAYGPYITEEVCKTKRDEYCVELFKEG